MKPVPCSSRRSVVSPITCRYRNGAPRATGRPIQFVRSVHNTDPSPIARTRSPTSQCSAKPGITASSKAVCIGRSSAARTLLGVRSNHALPDSFRAAGDRTNGGRIYVLPRRENVDASQDVACRHRRQVVPDLVGQPIGQPVSDERLSETFRGKFVEALRRLFRRKKLVFAGALKALDTKARLPRLARLVAGTQLGRLREDGVCRAGARAPLPSPAGLRRRTVRSQNPVGS